MQLNAALLQVTKYTCRIELAQRSVVIIII